MAALIKVIVFRIDVGVGINRVAQIEIIYEVVIGVVITISHQPGSSRQCAVEIVVGNGHSRVTVILGGILVVISQDKTIFVSPEVTSRHRDIVCIQTHIDEFINIARCGARMSREGAVIQPEFVSVADIDLNVVVGVDGAAVAESDVFKDDIAGTGDAPEMDIV